MRRHVPSWAIQVAVGVALVLVAIGLFAALLGAAVRGPTAFFDELGRNVARLAPQPQPDVRDDGQLKAVIRAMPDGKLRVGSVVEDKDQVVFTVTASRASVRAGVKPGDELRIGRDGEHRDRADRDPRAPRSAPAEHRGPQTAVLRPLEASWRA